MSDAYFFCVCLCLLQADCLIHQVVLVSSYNDRGVFWSILLELGYPGLYTLKGVRIGDVIYEDYAGCPFVVYSIQGMVPLLAGCVPYVKGEFALTNVNCFGQKARVNSGLLLLAERAVDVSERERSLAHC